MSDVLPTDWAPEAAKALGDWISSQRRKRGLSRAQLATKMGYQNVSKGASRIADWETGRDYPRGDRLSVLRAGLECDTDTPRKLLEAFLVQAKQTDQTKRRETNRRARVGLEELHLLRQHAVLLRDHSRAILNSPEDGLIRIGQAIAQLAYIGSTTLTLGQLLQSWADGTLRSDDESGSLYIVRIAGSPLSGRHQVTGFRTEGDSLAYTTVSDFSRRAGSLLKQRAPRLVTRDCLAGLLARRGVPVSPLEIIDHTLNTSYRYNYKTRLLETPAGPIDLNLRFGAALNTQAANWTPRWDNTGGNKRVLSQLQPLRTGIWRGDALEVSVADQRAWTATPGVITDEQGTTRFTLSGIAPPALITWLLETT